MITLAIELFCDHPGCNHQAKGTASLTTDGRLVGESLPDHWRIGEQPVENIRTLYTLCPLHAGSMEIETAIQAAIEPVKGQPVSIETLDLIKRNVTDALLTLSQSGRIPPTHSYDIRVETNGTISISFNDPRGPVHPN